MSQIPSMGYPFACKRSWIASMVIVVATRGPAVVEG